MTADTKESLIRKGGRLFVPQACNEMAAKDGDMLPKDGCDKVSSLWFGGKASRHEEYPLKTCSPMKFQRFQIGELKFRRFFPIFTYRELASEPCYLSIRIPPVWTRQATH
jgi:hypothetical protein